MKRFLFPMACMAMLTTDALATIPTQSELAGREQATRTVHARLTTPVQHMRYLRAQIATTLSKRLPWDDYYAQRGQHFSGSLNINTVNGEITGDIRTDVVITGNDHSNLYFLTFLPIVAVTDSEGNPVTFEEIYEFGYKLTKLTLSTPLNDGDQKAFIFSVSGVPECSIGGPLSVNICHFGEGIAYLAMDLFLPGSISGDFATYDLYVTVPVGQVIASTGYTEAVLPAADSEHETHHLVQDFPTDVHSMGIAPYQVANLPWQDSWIRTYTLGDSIVQSLVGKTLLDIKSILEFYSSLYGEFLFPEMEACQITDDAGAAFGWPTLLWIPDTMWLFGTGASSEWEDSQRTALIAHELGHQWFPDMMKSGDPYGAWLSEGFAEFLSVSYMAHLFGDDYAEGVFDQYGVIYIYYVPRSSDYALTSKESQWVSDPTIYQIVTYYKGATVANTIRSVIGNNAWITALQNLYKDYAGKDAYYDTKTLQKYLEQAYGQKLDWLFNEWVYGRGYPIYTFDVSRLRGSDSIERVQVRVRRAANFESLKFSMPITFRVVTEKGETDHVEFVDQDDMSFIYELDSRLIKVKFDPLRTFIKRVVPGLPGDADFSGEVDGIDLLYIAWAYGSALGKSFGFLPWVDFDGNAMNDDKDKALVLDNFGSNSDIEEVTP